MTQDANDTGIMRKFTIKTTRSYAIHSPDEAGITAMLESFLREAHPTMSNSRNIASTDPLRSVQALAIDRPHNAAHETEGDLITLQVDRQAALRILQIMETVERKGKASVWWARLVSPTVSLFINDLRRALVPL